MGERETDVNSERRIFAVAVVLSLPALLGYPVMVLCVVLMRLLSVPPNGPLGTALGIVSFIAMFLAPWFTLLLVIVMVWRRPRSPRSWMLTLVASSLVAIVWRAFS